MSQTQENRSSTSSEHDGSTDMELSSGSEALVPPPPSQPNAEQDLPGNQDSPDDQVSHNEQDSQDVRDSQDIPDAQESQNDQDSQDIPDDQNSNANQSDSANPMQDPSRDVWQVLPSSESSEAEEARKSSTPPGIPEGYNEHGIVTILRDNSPVRTSGPLLDRTPGYPPRGFIVPTGTSLQDRCANHPNQLWDHNLDPFLGVWGPGQIYEGLPKRIQADLDRRGADLASRSQFLDGRMKNRVKELNKEERLQDVVDENRERENLPELQTEDDELLARYVGGRRRRRIVQRDSENEDADDEDVPGPQTRQRTRSQVASNITNDNAAQGESRPQSGSQRLFVTSSSPEPEDNFLQDTLNLNAQSQLRGAQISMATPFSRNFFAQLAQDENNQHVVPEAVRNTLGQASTTGQTVIAPSQPPRPERPSESNIGPIRTTTTSETRARQASQQALSQPRIRPRLEIPPSVGRSSQGLAQECPTE